MKKPTQVMALAVLSGSAMAADVGVSVSIGQPGFYGRIDIGNMSQPPMVVMREPILVQRMPARVVQPIYLRVPPGHQKNWSKHCARYDACGVPVYFVKEDWYARQYAGGERGDDDEHGHGRKDHGKGHGHGKNRD